MFVENDPRGSVWRKWDLHIHSPASFEWRGAKLTGSQGTDDLILAQMIKAINESDADVFCLMDYWHLDGWFALQNYLQRNNLQLDKKVFPGIELRLEAHTKYRLNTHFLFDDTLNPQRLKDFIATLRIGGGTINRPPSADSFAELARLYSDDKLQVHGFPPSAKADDAEMTRLGMMTAEITRDSWREAKSALKERVLIIQPFDTSDGLAKLDWRENAYDATELMFAPDFFETRDTSAINLFQGPGHPTRPDITENFKQSIGGKWKPAICGSDAHSFDKYGIYPSDKICWIKADPTFAGLRQCTIDPIGRVFIGSEPGKIRHKRENKTKYISELSISKNQNSGLLEHWFNLDMPINSGMSAIFGNKGTGKSALADIIALAGNSHCPSFEFLNDKRFRKSSDNKSAQFKATLTWESGEKVTVELQNDTDKTKPERVRYLPQQYLEQLCTDIGVQGTNRFEAELKKVIFSHTPNHLKLGLESLDQVIDFHTEQIKKHISILQREIAEVNKEIAEIERDTRPDNIASVKNELDLKNQELISHSKTTPTLAPLPTSNGAENILISQQINDLRNKIDDTQKNLQVQLSLQSKNTSAYASAQRLMQGLRNISANIEQELADLATDAKALNLETTNLINYSINFLAVEDEQTALQNQATALAVSIGAINQEKSSLESQFSILKDKASEADRAYQKSLEERKEWDVARNNIIGNANVIGSIIHLQNKYTYLANEAPLLLSNLALNRLLITEEVFQEIQKQVEIYKKLYLPVELAIAEHKFIKDNIKLGFDAILEASGFTADLLSMLNQGRRGTFYGQADGSSAAHKIVQRHNFISWQDTENFIADVLSSLSNDKRIDNGPAVDIKGQLRDNISVENIYDFLFGLSYLRPRITLQLSGKEVEELSPGERGILLLVFYLLLDQEEIPLIIDQPEHNLDNSSVFHLLEPCIRYAKQRRQIILVTHNPNVAIVCDAEQVIFAEIDKQNGNKVTYTSGSIENQSMNLSIVDILEGTWPAFSMRDTAYQRIIS